MAEENNEVVDLTKGGTKDGYSSEGSDDRFEKRRMVVLQVLVDNGLPLPDHHLKWFEAAKKKIGNAEDSSVTFANHDINGTLLKQVHSLISRNKQLEVLRLSADMKLALLESEVQRERDEKEDLQANLTKERERLEKDIAALRVYLKRSTDMNNMKLVLLESLVQRLREDKEDLQVKLAKERESYQKDLAALRSRLGELEKMAVAE